MIKNLTKAIFLSVLIIKGFQPGIASSIEHTEMSANSNQHQNESAIGIHGMVLINVGEKLIASHLPLHHPVHKYQLVFEVDLDLPKNIENRELITLMPEKFDLFDLGEGVKKSFNSIVYKGHFERGGKAIGRAEVKVKKILLFKELKEEGKDFGYYEVALDEKKLLVIHKIQARPSFDQIFLLNGNFKDRNKDTSNKYFKSKLPETTSTLAKRYGLEVTKVKSIYLETQDFQ